MGDIVYTIHYSHGWIDPYAWGVESLSGFDADHDVTSAEEMITRRPYDRRNRIARGADANNSPLA